MDILTLILKKTAFFLNKYKYYNILDPWNKQSVIQKLSLFLLACGIY
jgi:hypothetical protein